MKKPIKNIFMCLVHESQDCIIDLIRNLKYLDPASTILLYNGGTDENLFANFPFEKYGVLIHPDPKPLRWGWLHDFAIDCMEYAIDNLEFDTITVVDSDQLACGKNYSHYISEVYHQNPDLGMLGQLPSRVYSNTNIDPAVTAYQEKELWQAFLDQFPNGKEAFLYWTFWPSTVFTHRASVALVSLFRENIQLHEILSKTNIWASEEILLPTLVIALGFSIVKNPCTYDTVKYKEIYTEDHIQNAISSHSSFWIHPVERNMKDTNRTILRTHFENYVCSYPLEFSEDLFQLINTIYPKVKNIEGWLEKEEFELLTELVYQKAKRTENAVFLEVGSYCGKATSAIALVTKHINNQSKIIAVDDFTGRLGAEDTVIDQYPPSYNKIINNLNGLDLLDNVRIIKQLPHLTVLNEKIDFLLIDGLHDYANVARDFYRFEKNLNKDALILFHDHCQSFPGVISFVKELLHDKSYQIIKQSISLIAIQKKDSLDISDSRVNTVSYHRSSKIQEEEFPLVSCIMPTYNRPESIIYAIDQFLEQSYPNKELIILDDGEHTIAPLIPDNDQIKYLHIQEKLDIGSKRNKACKMSNGNFIIHLDDDDFYAPNWIEKQLSYLIKNNLEITGLSNPLFYDATTSTYWQYNYPHTNKAWVYGATLCYTKKLWESNPFPVTNCGEDNAFVWAQGIQKILPNNIMDAYIGQIHYRNTSPKQTNNNRWAQLSQKEISRIFTKRTVEAIPIFSAFNNK